MRTSRVCRICTLDCTTTLSGWPCRNTLECPIAPAYLNRPDARFQDQMLVFKIDTPYFAVSPGRLITTPPFVKGAIVWSTYLNMLKLYECPGILANPFVVFTNVLSINDLVISGNTQKCRVWHWSIACECRSRPQDFVRPNRGQDLCGISDHSTR